MRKFVVAFIGLFAFVPSFAIAVVDRAPFRGDHGGGGGGGEALVALILIFVAGLALIGVYGYVSGVSSESPRHKQYLQKEHKKRLKKATTEKLEEEARKAFWGAITYEDEVRETEWYRRSKEYKTSPHTWDIDENLDQTNRIRADYGFPPIKVPKGGHAPYGTLSPKRPGGMNKFIRDYIKQHS